MRSNPHYHQVSFATILSLCLSIPERRVSFYRCICCHNHRLLPYHVSSPSSVSSIVQQVILIMAPHHSSIAAFPSAAAEFERYDVRSPSHFCSVHVSLTHSHLTWQSTKLPNGYRVWSGKHGHAWASYDGELDQSESDTREYSLIRLNNGMEVMVVVRSVSLGQEKWP